MISRLILLALLAAPASAATVQFEQPVWGKSIVGGSAYRLTATGQDVAQPDGSTLIASFAFYNCICAGTGHSRSFSGSITDGALTFGFSLDVDTTWNRPFPTSNTPDEWALSVDLPEGYRIAYDRWSVPEGAWGHAWIYREADPTPAPVPVPVPATGGLLAAALAWFGLKRRREPELEPQDGGWAESRAARNAPLDDHDIEELMRDQRK